LTLLVGRREGHPACKKMGRWWRWALVSPDGVAPSQMVDVSACVNLPLRHKVQKFSYGTCSPGWSWKKGHKTVVVVWLSGAMAMARSSSDDSRIHYVLPVLWMTSCFTIMGHLACGGSTAMDQVVTNLQRIRQVAPRCLTLLAVTTCRMLPMVGGLQRAV